MKIEKERKYKGKDKILKERFESEKERKER
jgi:hypothetical protein